MVVFGIPAIDEYISGSNIVEINADWEKHSFELADLINRRSFLGPVHVVIYSGREYIDVNKLYMDMEPFIRDNTNVSLSWGSSIESIVYDLSLLPRVREGTVFLILPYPWDVPSHIIATKMPVLRRMLSLLEERGWSIVVVNPLRNNPRRQPIVHLAETIIKIDFNEEDGTFTVRSVKTPIYKPSYAIGLSII